MYHSAKQEYSGGDGKFPENAVVRRQIRRCLSIGVMHGVETAAREYKEIRTDYRKYRQTCHVPFQEVVAGKISGENRSQADHTLNGQYKKIQH